MVEAEIPRSQIGFYAASLLNMGTELEIKSPPELVEATRRKAKEIAERHR